MKPKMIYRVMLRSLFQDIAMGRLHDGLSFSCYFSTSDAPIFSTRTYSVLKAHVYYFFQLFLCLLIQFFKKQSKTIKLLDPTWICYFDTGSISAQLWTFQASMRASCLPRRVRRQSRCCTSTPRRAAESTEQMVTNEGCSSVPQFSVCLKRTLLHLFCSSLGGQPH